MKLRAETLRDLGAALSPFNAFLFLQGIETLQPADGAPRRERARRRRVPRRRAAGGRPRCATRRASRCAARSTCPRGAGAVFSFDLAGGREAGRRFIEALTLWSHLANVGDARSLVIQPASTTHRQLSDEELAGAGHRPGHDPPVGRPRGSSRPAGDLEQSALRRAAVRRERGAVRGYQDPRDDRRGSSARRAPSRSSGCPRTSCAPSHFVGFYLQRHGYRVIPVNPRETEILGRAQLPVARGRPRADRRRRRLPPARRRAGDRRGGSRGRRGRALAPVRRDQRRGRRDRARAAGSRW